MATPIDFDGGTYDEPIPDVDFRVGPPRTRWGWKRALKKLMREEERNMARTSHGHHIPGTAAKYLHPDNVSKCGGVGVCTRCTAEVEQYGDSEQNSDVVLFTKAVEHGRKCQDLENAMLWEEYKAARKEWMEFLNSGFEKDTRMSLVRSYWAERDRGLTGE